jgi:hypothetical protein
VLLLYCGRELRGGDIPHRHSVGQLVVEAFKDCYSKLITDLSVSTAAVCFCQASDVYF